jgi:hypothetical protein
MDLISHEPISAARSDLQSRSAWLNFMPPNKAMSQQRNAVVIAARYAGRQDGGRLVE